MPLLDILRELNEGNVEINNFETRDPEYKVDIINQVFKNIGTAWSAQGTFAARNPEPLQQQIRDAVKEELPFMARYNLDNPNSPIKFEDAKLQEILIAQQSEESTKREKEVAKAMPPVMPKPKASVPAPKDEALLTPEGDEFFQLLKISLPNNEKLINKDAFLKLSSKELDDLLSLATIKIGENALISKENKGKSSALLYDAANPVIVAK